MSNEFTEKYFRPCVKDFVSTVLLIDDQLEYGEPMPSPVVENESLVIPTQGVVQPYVEGKTLVFPSTSSVTADDGRRKVYVTDLIKSFSKEGLLVTPINPNKLGAPNSDECINTLLKLAEKADVIILDWDMTVQIAGANVFSGNELPKKVVERLKLDNKYRLVMIYTADTKKSVEDAIQPSENIGLSIYGKSATTGTDVKDYNELAKQVSIDFLAKKKGLLGSALLTSLTALRKSTYSMLNTLNSDYDEALLYHRLLLSNPDKVADFCKDIIEDEILAHVYDTNVETFFTKDAFRDFISEYNIKIVVKASPNSEEREVASESFDTLVDKGYTAFFEKTAQALIASGKNLDLLVHTSKDRIMKSFSYYSTMLSSDYRPNLKLGCIVKLNDDFFLCIQPPCDSERIDKLKSSGKCKNPQNFLFLKLEKKENNISFYVKENDSFLGLRLRYKSVEAFLFAGDANGFVSQNENGDYITYSTESESVTLHYICCLKPMFAQKIANNFAANISRIGIDQFEWLRLKGRD